MLLTNRAVSYESMYGYRNARLNLGFIKLKLNYHGGVR